MKKTNKINKIAIIGCGNMGAAILEGIYKNSKVMVCESDPKKNQLDISSQNPDVGEHQSFIKGKAEGNPCEISFNHKCNLSRSGNWNYYQRWKISYY